MWKLSLIISSIIVLVFGDTPSCTNNCASYFDGCNACSCGSNNAAFAACSFRLCSPEQILDPYCQICFDGYTLNSDQNSSFGCSPSVGCGINNCNAYYDGCNSCSCGNNGFQICTLRFCSDEETTDAYCTGCEDGYELSSNQTESFGCVLSDNATIATTTAVEVGCTDGCSVYFDGCNTCNCGSNGFAFCTLKFCEIKGEPYCISCEAGYTLNGDQANDFGCENTTEITTTIAEPEVGCDYGCASYFDGCNYCTCGSNGFAFCTLKFCAEREEPYCSTCQEGYQLTSNGCEPIGCGNGCIAYFDGCNSCGCSDAGPSFCTLRSCEEDEYELPYCATCDTGYELNSLGYCDMIDNVTTTTAPVEIGCDSGCDTYFDGCNSCQCGSNGFAFCTLIFCLEPGDAYCTSCQDGYELANDGSCMISSTPTTTIAPSVGCDSGCSVYNDGCNTCSCAENGVQFCTLIYCFAYNDPYCISCQDGYILSDTTPATCYLNTTDGPDTTDAPDVTLDNRSILLHPSYILYASLFIYALMHIL